MFLSGENLERGKCISAQGSSVKGSSQQSSTSFPKVKGRGPIIFRPGPTYYGGGGFGKRYYTGISSLTNCEITSLGVRTGNDYLLVHRLKSMMKQMTDNYM